LPPFGPAHMTRPTGRALRSAGGVLFLATVLMLVFRQKYPRWRIDWNIGLTKFGTRVGAYLALLRDEYPSTDEDQAVHIEIPYPDAKKDLNRWLPLVKWLLAIPHYIILFFLGIAAIFVVIMTWFAILFTGRYPKGFFDFVVGVMRWSLRVSAYAALLTTDEYAPSARNVRCAAAPRARLEPFLPSYHYSPATPKDADSSISLASGEGS
jgi:hypothetical protein